MKRAHNRIGGVDGRQKVECGEGVGGSGNGRLGTLMLIDGVNVGKGRGSLSIWILETRTFTDDVHNVPVTAQHLI